MIIDINQNFVTPSYQYCIGSGIFSQELAKIKNNYSSVVIVTDSLINDLYLSETLVEKIVLDQGEEVKCFNSLTHLIQKFSQLQLKRNSLIIAVGGGVIGDLAGFAASIYLRGVDYWQVPTTLVAMVDSSIGGKTGINTDFGKNLVGAFYPPKKIIVDLNFLTKLPEVEVKNGLAEMYKHALISNMDLVEELFVDPSTENCVYESAKIKIEIIEKDPLEKNERKYLNIGHTIAHAIEKDSKYSVSHGAAVAMGIAIESHLGLELGLISEQNFRIIMNGLNRLELPTTYKIKDLEFFAESLKSDKKNQSEKITFSLVIEPGEKVVVAEVELAKVLEFLSTNYV
jgi:3-dehydroquinate synthase